VEYKVGFYEMKRIIEICNVIVCVATIATSVYYFITGTMLTEIQSFLLLALIIPSAYIAFTSMEGKQKFSNKLEYIIAISVAVITMAAYYFVTNILLPELQPLLLSVFMIISAFARVRKSESRKFDFIFSLFIIAGIFSAVVAVMIFIV